MYYQALEHEDTASFFKDLAQHGCVSGIVSSLVHSTDTHEFYGKCHHEIEKISQEIEDKEDTVYCPWPEHVFSRRAFEITASRMAKEIGLE